MTKGTTGRGQATSTSSGLTQAAIDEVLKNIKAKAPAPGAATTVATTAQKAKKKGEGQYIPAQPSAAEKAKGKRESASEKGYPPSAVADLDEEEDDDANYDDVEYPTSTDVPATKPEGDGDDDVHSEKGVSPKQAKKLAKKEELETLRAQTDEMRQLLAEKEAEKFEADQKAGKELQRLKRQLETVEAKSRRNSGMNTTIGIYGIGGTSSSRASSSPNSSNSEVTRSSKSKGSGSPPKRQKAPAVVTHIEKMTFGADHSQYFMDESHFGPDAVPKTRADVDDIRDKMRAQRIAFPGVQLVVSSYFSDKARRHLRDFVETNESLSSKLNASTMWDQESMSEDILEILYELYPQEKREESALASALIAAKAYVLAQRNAFTYDENKKISQQRGQLIYAMRLILEENLGEGDTAMDHMRGLWGEKIAHFITITLRKRNDKWNDDLVKQFEVKTDKLCSTAGKRTNMNLIHTQQVIDAKMTACYEARELAKDLSPVPTKSYAQAAGNRDYANKASLHSMGTSTQPEARGRSRERSTERQTDSARPRSHSATRSISAHSQLSQGSAGGYHKREPERARSRTPDREWQPNMRPLTANAPPYKPPPRYQQGDETSRYRPPGQGQQRPSDHQRQGSVERAKAYHREHIDEPRVNKTCKHCGRRHGVSPCDFLGVTDRWSAHPDVNLRAPTWEDSDTYRNLTSISKTITVLPHGKQLKRADRDHWYLVATNEGPPTTSRKVSDENITIPNASLHEVIDICSMYSEYNAQEGKRGQRNIKEEKPYAEISKDKATVLLDSGCIGRDFITENACTKLKVNKYPLKFKIEVKSIHGTELATEVVMASELKIKYKDQTVRLKQIPLVVIKEGPADIIVGHQTLREHNVYAQLNRYFGNESLAEVSPAVKEKSYYPQPACQVDSITSPRSSSTSITMGNQKVKVVHISELIPTGETDDTTYDLLPEEIYATYEQDPQRREDEITFKIKGTSAEQAQLLKLLQKHSDIFARRLNRKPASVTPMKMEVDYTAYKADRRSREPTRAQSAARKAAIAKWINQAVADNIIKRSSATAWAQLMLTRKPNGSWRFNVDYRALNKHTKANRAPIPNIKKLLNIIGAKNPKLFAKMDLTQGFYQAPMDEGSMEYTAFDCDEGLYEFTRVSMGLLNSPWHFQGVMEREVFPHLLNKIMTIYIDDLLTWAQNIDELCANLEMIFEALKTKGMTLNPDKCEFGLTEVEFVGHLIDNNGLTFTEEKKKQVEKMPIPITKGELKTFLGLGGYFRSHVDNLATLEQPLNEMLTGYVKKDSTKKLVWTTAQQEQFYIVQHAIVNCRKLYYAHPDLPIRIYTDASDYGIGSYLCQVYADGSEVPIEFISKTLTKAERKWSTYEKEAFAIFYSLRKWEHLVRDVKFTLFTDHKNLTYLTKDPSPKVMRWRMAVQDYDFDIAYIPGEKNIIADAFSRLCNRTRPEDQEEMTATISSILANAEEMEEWISPCQRDPSRYGELEKERTQYWIEENESVGFFSMHAAATQTKDAKDVKKRQYIPRDKSELIAKCHNHDIGHWGINRTIEMCRECIAKDQNLKDMEWHCMRKDVETFILECDVCRKMSQQKLTSHVHQYTTSEYGIMKCIALDAIHMPKTKAGNKYIVTVIDTFTRYTALYAIKDLTAQTAAKLLMNHMCVYGVPVKITSDNSTEFEKEFREAVEILATENYKTHAYSHQENGLVERANKEVIRHTRNLTYELRKSETWDEELLKVQAIMNEKVSESTGLTPNQILFAGQINLHEGRIFPQPSLKQRKHMSKYMKQQLDFQDELMKLAIEKQDHTDAVHMANSDDNEIRHQIGEYLVVRHESGKAPHKLAVRWHGPYRITTITNRPQGTVYTVYCPASGNFYDFHASIVQSHPCTNDTEATRCKALDDLNIFIIEEIAEHRIAPDGKSMDLKVKWSGTKELEWTGMNMSLKKNRIVQAYMKKYDLTVKFGIKPSEDVNDEPPKKRVRFSEIVNGHVNMDLN